jgi:hypothetical protein
VRAVIAEKLWEARAHDTPLGINAPELSPMSLARV